MDRAHPIIVACRACGQRNRIPVSKLGRQGRCGKCQAELSAPAVPVEVDSAHDLRAILDGASVPVLVDFWASWCGPCRMVAPEIAKVAARGAGDWLVVKANTEADPRLGAEHGVRSIPMMAVFQRGREVARTAGVRPAAAIEDFVRQSIAAA